MSLDNIQLTNYHLQYLYNKSLVDLEPKQENTESLQVPSIYYLGKNEKGLIIIINEAEHAFLSDDDLNFLVKMMSACAITLADMALVNIHLQSHADYQTITQQLKPEKIIFFGTEPGLLSFPLEFPHYQVQRYNKQDYLAAPALSVLQANKDEKTRLWVSLQKLFLLP
ncbi:MAG: hypothetical protein ABIY51_03885 [Ferruginibacter sp.]